MEQLEIALPEGARRKLPAEPPTTPESPSTPPAAIIEPTRPEAPRPVRPVGREAPPWFTAPSALPQHLAAVAIGELGPQVRAWVTGTRERYPDATPDALARLAATELLRTARLRGAAAAAQAPVGFVTASGALAREQAKVVLAVAAVYGAEPTPAELVGLLRAPTLTATRAGWASIAKAAGAILVRGGAARVLPFGSAIAGAVQSGRGCAAVAARSIEYYRNPSRLRRYV